MWLTVTFWVPGVIFERGWEALQTNSLGCNSLCPSRLSAADDLQDSYYLNNEIISQLSMSDIYQH